MYQVGPIAFQARCSQLLGSQLQHAMGVSLGGGAGLHWRVRGGGGGATLWCGGVTSKQSQGGVGLMALDCFVFIETKEP